jgi:hypothetical protein
MPTPDRWQATWRGLDLAPPARLYEEICLR